MVDKITVPISQTGLINKVNELIDSGASIAVDTVISSTSENPVQNKVIYAALTAKADKTQIPTKTSDLTNDSHFIQTIKVNGTAQTVNTSTVDLTAPVVYDSNMVIQRNSTPVGTFTANQTTARTINITVPTSAADIGALPDTTTIGAGNTTIKVNSTIIGTVNANQTANTEINVAVSLTATYTSATETLTLSVS